MSATDRIRKRHTSLTTYRHTYELMAISAVAQTLRDALTAARQGDDDCFLIVGCAESLTDHIMSSGARDHAKSVCFRAFKECERKMRSRRD